MSLQGLISGSECAVPTNPLSQVLKHTEGDRSLQQDRVAGSSSSRLHHLPASGSPATLSSHDAALARQFFETEGSAPPQAAMHGFVSPRPLPHMTSPHFNEAWGEMKLREQDLGPEAVPSMINTSVASSWASEYGNVMHVSSPATMAQQTAPSQTSAPIFYHAGMYRSPYQTGMYGGMQNMSASQQSPITQDVKGKGKMSDAAFEAAFAEALNLHSQASSRIVEVSGDEASVEELADKLHASKLDEGSVDDMGTAELNADFKQVWENLQDSGLPPSQEEMAKWEAEFNQLMTSQRESLDYDYTEAMQKAWEGGLGDLGNDYQSMQYDEEGIPLLGDYQFETNNHYLGPSTSSRSLLDDAKALLSQSGSLTEAALMLEAAIQKGELGRGGYEAWLLLGDTRTMDEREEQGMRALTEGVRRAEEAGDAGKGMMSLAISFANEGHDRASSSMLLRWLRAHSPRLHIPPETLDSVKLSAWDSHERVAEAFMSLARSQHEHNVVEPDVQIGLGVLFYTKADYDRAKDCFESALAQRPDDFLLWNRFGSCLSNGSKPEEALGAYREALRLRPTYTRAVYNVAVACMNIGAHQEAAEHLLGALASQDLPGGQKSDQLWFTLKRNFEMMDRPDLAGQADARQSVENFRQADFDF